jgi:hypothetical protein
MCGDFWRCVPIYRFDLVNRLDNRLVNTGYVEIAISEFKAKCIQVLKQASVSDQEWIVKDWDHG